MKKQLKLKHCLPPLGFLGIFSLVSCSTAYDPSENTVVPVSKTQEVSAVTTEGKVEDEAPSGVPFIDSQ